MHEFLAVLWVPLVGVVDHELAAVGHDERFPDGSFAVVGDCAAAGGDVAYEVPGVSNRVIIGWSPIAENGMLTYPLSVDA